MLSWSKVVDFFHPIELSGYTDVYVGPTKCKRAHVFFDIAFRQLQLHASSQHNMADELLEKTLAIIFDDRPPILSYPILSNNSVRKSKSINMKRWRRALRMIKIVWFTPYPLHTDWLSYSFTIVCLLIRMRRINAPWHFRVSFIGANTRGILSNGKNSMLKSIPNFMRISNGHHVLISSHQTPTNNSCDCSLWPRV